MNKKRFINTYKKELDRIARISTPERERTDEVNLKSLDLISQIHLIIKPFKKYKNI